MSSKRLATLETHSEQFWDQDLDQDRDQDGDQDRDQDRDEAWERSYHLLREFVDKYRKLPNQKIVYDGENLGEWISIQRRAKQGTGSSQMTQERQKALEKIQGWFWDLDPDKAWEQSYSLLREYVKEHQMIPGRTTIYRGKKLGIWVCNQRQRSNKMSDHRIKALEKIQEWRWKQDRDEAWERSYNLLRTFVGEHKKMPGRAIIYHGKKLGLWVHNQRRAMRCTNSHKMTFDRKARLETIPEWREYQSALSGGILPERC